MKLIHYDNTKHNLYGIKYYIYSLKKKYQELNRG